MIQKPGSLGEQIARFLSDPADFPLEFTSWLRKFLDEPTNYTRRISGKGGIQFDVQPQPGDWLSLETSGSIPSDFGTPVPGWDPSGYGVAWSSGLGGTLVTANSGATPLQIGVGDSTSTHDETALRVNAETAGTHVAVGLQLSAIAVDPAKAKALRVTQGGLDVTTGASIFGINLATTADSNDGINETTSGADNTGITRTVSGSDNGGITDGISGTNNSGYNLQVGGTGNGGITRSVTLGNFVDQLLTAAATYTFKDHSGNPILTLTG